MSIGQAQGIFEALTDHSGPSPFKAVLRKPTPFALESQSYEFLPDPRFGFQTSCLIPRNGDLLTNATLLLTVKQLPSAYPKAAGAWYPAECLVHEVQLVLGGTVVEKFPGEYLRLYDTFHRTFDASEAYKKSTNFDSVAINSDLEKTQTLRLPLPFTFCRHWDAALPLVCLPSTEVKINVTFKNAVDAGVNPGTLDARLEVQYAYLGDEERRTLASSDQEVLVEQVQWSTFELPDGVPSTSGPSQFSVRLNFTNPVKSLYWAVKNTTTTTSSRTHSLRFIGDAAGTYQALTESQFVPSGLAPMSSRLTSEHLAPIFAAKILWGGQERSVSNPGSWYGVGQAQTHAAKVPPAGMYMYSFALDPDSRAPTGFANFAATEDVRLSLVFKKSVASVTDVQTDEEAANVTECTQLLVCARSYNVLQIPRGGGRATMLWG